MEVQHISLEACIHGHVYRLESRNLSVGVFDSTAARFIGIRDKFGDQYLDAEYHWDTGPKHGTAKPLQALGPVPPGVEVTPHLESGRNWPLFNFLLLGII